MRDVWVERRVSEDSLLVRSRFPESSCCFLNNYFSSGGKHFQQVRKSASLTSESIVVMKIVLLDYVQANPPGALEDRAWPAGVVNKRCRL